MSKIIYSLLIMSAGYMGYSQSVFRNTNNISDEHIHFLTQKQIFYGEDPGEEIFVEYNDDFTKVLKVKETSPIYSEEGLSDFIYNNSGKIEFIEYFYDDLKDGVEKYTYDDQQRISTITVYIIEDLDGEDIEKENRKYIYTYNNNSQPIRMDYHHNGMYSYSFIFSYNAQGNLVSILKKDMDNDEEQSKITYQYDSQNVLLGGVLQVNNPYQGGWVNKNKYELKYDDSKKNVIEKITYIYSNEENWMNNFKYINTYDETKLQTKTYIPQRYTYFSFDEDIEFNKNALVKTEIYGWLGGEWLLEKSENYTYESKSLKINSPSLSKEVSIYPNPTQGLFYIQGADSSVVKIYTQTGKLLKVFKNIQNGCDISDLASGVYIALVKNGQQTKTFKILKK